MVEIIAMIIIILGSFWLVRSIKQGSIQKYIGKYIKNKDNARTIVTTMIGFIVTSNVILILDLVSEAFNGIMSYGTKFIISFCVFQITTTVTRRLLKKQQIRVSENIKK